MSFVREEGYSLEQGLESVGKGWAELIREAFSLMPSGVKIVQVKEKFGALRIYADNINPAYQWILDSIEDQSLKTCEDCGKEGSTKGSRGWIRCLCRGCREAYEAKREA